jgi:hypothetical protein
MRIKLLRTTKNYSTKLIMKSSLFQTLYVILLYMVLFKTEVTGQEVNYSQPKYFSPEATNFERFRNSPCYPELGFDASRDLKLLEQQYDECESRKRRKATKSILKTSGFTVIVILLTLGFLTTLFSKSYYRKK